MVNFYRSMRRHRIRSNLTPLTTRCSSCRRPDCWSPQVEVQRYLPCTPGLPIERRRRSVLRAPQVSKRDHEVRRDPFLRALRFTTMNVLPVSTHCVRIRRGQEFGITFCPNTPDFNKFPFCFLVICFVSERKNFIYV